MKTKKIILTLAILVMLISACTPQSAAQPAANETESQTAALQITVSILPQKYFVERIGGEFVKVNSMVIDGASPHTYEPKPEQMRELANAAAYFSIGIDFEDTWLDRIQSANPNMKIVNITTGIERIPMVAHHHEGEEAEHEELEEAHEESGLDPHTWTSTSNAKIMANNIYNELSSLDPDHQKNYEQNLQALNMDIEQLDKSIRNTLEGTTNRSFIVFHPSWGYFARDYNLNQIPIEIEGQEPSPQELVKIIDEAKEENCKVVFAQPGFSTKTADTIAQDIDGYVLLINPLEENWLDNMLNVAHAFSEALK